jgi:hypothetical protein
MTRNVIEADFRLPEFRDAKPEDYEFRADGKIVRKDRFVTGMNKIASILEINGRQGFEISDVIEKVELLMNEHAGWAAIETLDATDWIYHLGRDNPPELDVKLQDGSIVQNATRGTVGDIWWNSIELTDNIVSVRFRYAS